ADVDEGRFHARQHVLDLAEVDVSDQRGLLAVLLEVVFDGDTVLDDHELGLVTAFAHEHRAIDGFSPGEEFGLGDDGTTTSGLASLFPSLPLGLEAGRTLERSDFVAVAAPRAGAAATASAGSAVAVVVIVAVIRVRVLGSAVVGLAVRLLRIGVGALLRTSVVRSRTPS